MKYLSFSILLCWCCSVQAQLNVTATVTNATCTANGAVQAHTTGGTAPYNFVLLNASNVVIRPGQSDSLFQNLGAGSYKVAVYDAVNTVTPVTSPLVPLTLSYAAMTISSANGTSAPLPYTCTASSNAGSLYVNFNGGVAPFTVSILSGPTAATPVVTSNHNATVNGLATGTYVASVTDACNNTVSTGNVSVFGTSQAYPATITSIGSLSFYSQSSTATCGPRASYSLNVPSSIVVRWFLEYPAGSGNYTDTFQAGIFNQLPYINPSLLANASYRLFVQHPCTDVWQNVTQSFPSMVPLSASIDGNSGLYVNNNCDSIMPRIQTGLMSGNTANNFYCYPLHITIVDSFNQSVKVLDTMLTSPGAALNYNSYVVPYSGTYIARLTDAQGNAYQNVVIAIAQPPRKISPQPAQLTNCDASGLSILAYGVAPGNTFPVTFNLVSATGVANPAVYPPVVINSTTAVNQILQLWNNIPASNGAITYEVVFSCRRDTVTISTAKFRYAAAKLDSFSYRIGSAGCSGGKADVLLNAHITDTSGVNTTILSNNLNSYPFILRILPNGATNYVGNGYNQMIFNNLSPGTYRIGIAPNIIPFNNVPTTCNYWDTLTVVVPAFTAPAIDANRTFGMVCTGNASGQLQVVASGYTPFQYRIKAVADASYGAWQSSNQFSGLPAGNYNVQVMDGCNAISTQTASVTLAGNAASINTTGVSGGTVSLGNAVQLRFASIGPSAGTVWTRPDGTTFNGDTLNLASFSAADSGMYLVQATSAIGCLLQSNILLQPAVPLPLHLLSFSGRSDGKEDVLEWQTAADAGISYFSVEYSDKGSSFIPVGSIAFKTGTAAYTFRRTGSQGRAYYRLKITDPVSSGYSPVVSIQRSSNGAFTTLNEVYPVPFKNTLTFNISVPGAQDAEATLLDVTGRVVATKQLKLTAGSYDYTMEDLDGLDHGAYFLSVKAGAGEPVIRKVIK